MRYPSKLISMLLALLFGQSAYAATLVATTDEPAGGYAVGALVTITLTATNAPDETAASIDVRIVGAGFTGVSADTGAGGSCVPGFGCIPGAAYSVGGTQGNTVGGNFIALSQIGGLAPVAQTFGMDASVPPFATGNGVLTAVFTTIAGAPGTYPIMLSDVGAGFFGIAGPQSLGSYVVPEPTTAALMGLGLLGLAASGRKR